MIAPAALRADVAQAARVLSGLGLVTAFGHVSGRIGDRVVITPATDLGQVRENDLVEITADADTLPAGAPAETWIHLSLYRSRPDVSAIARGQPRAAFPVAAIVSALRPLHGQACWLGRSVPVHDDARLLRNATLADAAARVLPEGEALLLRGNGAVTVATTPGIAVARMSLLAAACEAWLAIGTAARPQLLDDAEISSWRAVGDELLPRLWRHLRRADSSADEPDHS